MLKTYFSIAFRNLVRHKAYSTINIAGLAVGIAACLLLFIVIRYETTYDSFQPNYHRIQHVVTQDTYSDGDAHTPGVPYPALDALRTDFPQITTGALFSTYGSQVTIPGNGAADKKFIEDNGIFFSDPEFFKVFQYKWLSGNEKVLAAPDMVVLSKSLAEKYFTNWQQATGKMIKLDNALTLKVAGIIEDVPVHSDFPLKLVASFITMKSNPSIYNYSTDWGNTTSNFQVFMLPPENMKAADIDAQLKTLSKKYYKSNGGINKRFHFLQPLTTVHSDTRFGNLGDHVTSKSILITLSLIGLLIIVMACINFINLSTAQAVSRSKEVGIRKVLGGNRLQLFGQMMGETFVIVMIASLLSLGIAALAMPYIKHIVSIGETLPLFNTFNLLLLAAIIGVVTVFSGLYPSLILSGFTPALALKNKITSANIGGISLRRGLVVTQFAISQVLIIGTIVSISQMDFVSNADLGFNKEAVLVLSSNGDSVTQSRLPAFKDALLKVPGIQAVSFSSDVPSSDNNWGTNFAYDHKPDADFTLFLKFGDEDYLKTYGLQLVAGHSYDKSDTIKDVLVNETLLKKLGVKNPAEAVGKEIRMGGGGWRTIAGVVKDFKTNSLREETKPTLISTRTETYGSTGIKLSTQHLSQTQAAIQSTWDKFFPEYANTSVFMDESIERFYQQEQQLSLLYKIFAGLAIFISCLGLYGLVSFMAVQKVKETGIRKVLGASVANIVYMFSKEFTLLIAIAFVVAAPAAYYLMNNWLNNFVDHVSISTGVFIIAIVTSLVIAWFTVGYKAIKAALANPVKSLRSE